MLETIRQYGAELLEKADERAEVSVRHLQWCLDAAAWLAADTGEDLGTWRSRFDQLADELRSALTWAESEPDHRAAAYRLATLLAELTYTRGMPGEAQRRHEQAAQLAADPASAASALRCAAAAALSRHVGADALRLYRSSAEADLRPGTERLRPEIWRRPPR